MIQANGKNMIISKGLTNPSCRCGYTLIEVILAITMLSIIALGALGYEYYAALHRKNADADLVATQVAQLVLEDWKNTGGVVNYNPMGLNMGFVIADQEGYQYSIDVDNVIVYMNLSYNDLGYDSASDITLRRINAQVSYPSGSDFVLSTYVRTDQSGG